MSRAPCLLVVLVLGGSAGAGCYRNDRTLATPAWARVTSRVRVANAPVVELAIPFEDQRPQPQRCGLRKIEKEVGTLFCASPPNLWLAALLAEDLRQSGFVVLDRWAPAGPAAGHAVQIDGVLSQFFVEPEVDFHSTFLGGTASDYLRIDEGDIGVRLHARGPRFEAQRRIYVKGLADPVDEMFQDPEQQAVERSVNEALRKMVLAIVELVNLAPGLEGGP
jgi:hypothetical protein